MVIEIAGYIFFQVTTEKNINDNGTLAAVASLVASSLEGGIASLPLNKYEKVAVDFYSGQSATKERILRDKGLVSTPPLRSKEDMSKKIKTWSISDLVVMTLVPGGAPYRCDPWRDPFLTPKICWHQYADSQKPGLHLHI